MSDKHLVDVVILSWALIFGGAILSITIGVIGVVLWLPGVLLQLYMGYRWLRP